MIKIILSSCYMLLISFASHSQNVAHNIGDAFESLLAHENIRNGIASIHIVDSESQQVVYERNSALGLPTASTLKVITAITAFEVLGADYRYTTQVGYAGVIDDSGILHGDIIISGSGDPTLGSERYAETKSTLLLRQWINAIHAQGIKAVQGRIIADDRLYSGNTIPDGWPWVDIGNYYGAGLSALNWKENKAGIQFKPGNIGAPAVITNLSADLSYLTLINDVSTGKRGSGDGVYAYAAPYSSKIYLRGTYGQDLNKTIEIATPDPAYQLAFDLHQSLEKAGIVIGNNPTTGQLLHEHNQPVPAIQTLVQTHQSPRLRDIIFWFNQRSINLYGEALLRSVTARHGKSTTAEAASFVRNFWAEKLKISVGELDIHDGSGLSPQNNVTTRAMNSIMQYAIGKPWHADFVKSLPTINQMTMKSGTISGTLGYTGYHTARNGKKYSFAFLLYNYQGAASAMRARMFSVLNNLR